MDITLFISAVTTIFVMSDPFGNIPLFLGLTGGMSTRERRYIITKASVAATIILVAFAVAGQPVMRLLNISLSSLSLAGGILLLLIAFDMLMSTGTHVKKTDSTAKEAGGEQEESPESMAITPMATPLIVGPGVMTATVVYMNKSSGIVDSAVILLAVLIAMAGSWIIVVNSDYLYAILHKDGTRVLTKIMGIVLAAIAIQMMISGLTGAFPVLQSNGLFP